MIPHPQYYPNDKNQYNDIALLRLESEVQYSDFIKPICLPFESKIKGSLYVKEILEVAGWAKTEKQSSSSTKLKSQVEGMANDQCNQAYRNEQRQINSNTQICAGKAKEFKCRSDLGGPLMKINYEGSPPYYYVAGIMSSDPSLCETTGKPAIFTHVGNYLDWIQATIKP
ncbi:hypothetical protein ACKWTF_013761 [Chironomus riparius]